jgi:hypothetical protein
LARLYWRRERLERAQTGMMRRALEEVEEWQHRRQREMAGATFDASQFWAIDTYMPTPADAGVRLRLLLSCLAVIREQVKQRTFKPRQTAVLEALYHNDRGWRQARLLDLVELFIGSFGPPAARRDPELEEMRRDQSGPLESAGEPQYQELLRLLDEEIASVQEEFEYAEKVNEEKAAIEREAALAPAGETWRMMLRQEGALDRSIDRKVRILLALRRQCPTADLPSAAPEGDNDTNIGEIDKVLEAEVPAQSLQAEGTSGNQKMRERSLNVDENKGPLWKTPERSWNPYENKGGYALKPGIYLKTGMLVNQRSSRYAPCMT